MRPQVQLAATSDRALLQQMLDDYLAELCAYAAVTRPYPYFEAYWQNPIGRWPYLILHAKTTAGFALVAGKASGACDTDFVMAEFYILPSHRSLGVGRGATRHLLAVHRGSWSLHVMQHNAGARAYWPKAIAQAGAREVTEQMHDDTAEYRFVT